MTVLADIWQQMEHPILSGVAIVAVLAVLSWAVRGAHRHLRNLTDLGEFVVPHFRPTTDEHGLHDDTHTIPARLDRVRTDLDGLRKDLVCHMDTEEALRAEDLERRHDRDAKLDGVIDRLIAGNPEIRSKP